ncbi:MAG: glycosyl hydrolase family 65 protein [Chthoniobacteraceae bacterium]|nr:glycosyl hydrolase family 65 protein [Chthoniobacteraceae bacterium]
MKTQTNDYLAIEPWSITEKGFHPDRSRVSESIFSLANEFMGIRGHFDEGFGGSSLVGSYFNGVFEETPHIYPNRLAGFPERNHFMVNAVNWLYTRLEVNGETLDLARSRVSEFVRKLDLRTGVMTRSFLWEVKEGSRLRVTFTRFLSMVQSRLGCQRIELEPLDFSGSIAVTLGLDFTPPHESAGRNFWNGLRKETRGGVTAILAETEGSGQKVFSAFRHTASSQPSGVSEITGDRGAKLAGVRLEFPLTQGVPLTLEKLVAHDIEKDRNADAQVFWCRALERTGGWLETTFERERARQAAYWEEVWKRFDISIDGDPANEQGTRYCIFQMLSTFHGVDPRLNIGAKGLTGEVYGGLAFWDTESYCLPFYLFTNPAAARNLLCFRYNTLPQARERARQLDCEGARYPMTTIDGTEACGVWHHGDLEIHVPAAVAYGIWHYVHITGDKTFLHERGLEMLIEISRFYASHGGWSPKTGEFGLWGVMGADEFHMMVHNNAYTNAMAKKTFEWTLQAIAETTLSAPERLAAVAAKVNLRKEEPARWEEMARKMRLQRNRDTGLIEQHDGYFDLPHIDLKALPPERKPVCAKFPYIKRSRLDWIKQPDVLLLMFFFSNDYSLEEKRVNFEYYEPRCVHESSLSPGIHSILATELGKHRMAFDYVQYASRLDLDDYNGNTSQGLHMTSMAAAWMSLVYGFGGMRSDGERLSFRPAIPAKWNSYSFRIVYGGALLEVRVDHRQAAFRAVEGGPVEIDVFGTKRTVGREGLSVELPAAAGVGAQNS